MPLPTSGAVQLSADELPRNGQQCRFLVAQAEYAPDNVYGPCVPLSLEVQDKDFYGASVKGWPKFSTPRLSFVREKRKEGFTDEEIAAALSRKIKAAAGKSYDEQVRENYGWTHTIDEYQAPRVGFSTALYKLMVACCGGSHKEARQLIQELDSFDDLARWFVDKTFVGTVRTKTKIGDDGEPRTYVNLSLEEDIFPDLEAASTARQLQEATAKEIEAANDEDFVDIPF